MIVVMLVELAQDNRTVEWAGNASLPMSTCSSEPPEPRLPLKSPDELRVETELFDFSTEIRQVVFYIFLVFYFF